jgi:outer membrane lipoprotein LolB
MKPFSAWRQRRNSVAAAALAATLLAGCAAVPRVAADRAAAESGWAQRSAALSALNGFELHGRLAGSALGARADLVWQQSADGRFSIRVSGPFGAGAIGLRGDAHQVEVTSRDGVLVTDDPEAWLYRELGWTLPVASLRWWVLGLPAPTADARLRVDGAGRAAELRQGQWTLRYTEYADAGDWSLPRRLEASNGEQEFRLLADRWTGLDAPP